MNSLMIWEKAIVDAAQRIDAYVVQTPVLSSAALSHAVGSPVWLKCEQLQPMGAFKIRGAANALLQTAPPARARGAVTYSTGNHGLAVAYMGRALQVPAVICLSDNVPDTKVAALRELGAQLVIQGKSQDEAQVQAAQIADSRGLLLIEPFDDPAIIAGQGTIGLEVLQQVPDVDTVVVPLSGGGLASGVAAMVKSRRPQIRVIGVSMEKSAVMHESLKKGHPVVMPEASTLADSLQGGIGIHNRYTFVMVRQFLDDVVLVSETEIQMAMGYLAVKHGLLVEGAAAVTVAFLLRAPLANRWGTTVAVLTGRNVAPSESCRSIMEYHSRAL